MKLLVLTSEPITARQLQDVLPAHLDPRQAEVAVVAPALHDNALRFWLSDADEAIARAEEVRRATVESLDDANVTASSDTGESDPIDAIEDALRTFDADRIVVFTHPDRAQRYRERVDPRLLEDQFGIPVDQAVVSSA